jgi:arginase
VTGTTLGIVGAPSSAGAYAPGQEKAPAALRSADLVTRLTEAGTRVVDHGDIPPVRWRPDPGRPLAQNVAAVAASSRAVAGRVSDVLAAGETPLVLGGDCTVELGTVAGHLPSEGRIGVVYFDLHADLNVPDAVVDGALDWMGVAHMLGEEQAVAELVALGPRQPLIDDDQIILFACAAEHCTPWELDVIDRRSLRTIALADVAADPEGAAISALRHAHAAWDRVLVHFDVDVVDFTDAPLSENTGRNVGLTLDTAFRALGALLESPRLSSLTITELNPDHGEVDGATLVRFVAGLADCFARRAPTDGR